MNAPPGKRNTPALAANRGGNLRLGLTYQLLCLVQASFEYAFWCLEQRKTHIADKLAGGGIEL